MLTRIPEGRTAVPVLPWGQRFPLLESVTAKYLEQQRKNGNNDSRITATLHQRRDSLTRPFISYGQASVPEEQDKN